MTSRTKHPQSHQSQLLHPEKERRLQNPETIDGTAPEIDRRGVREILGGTAQFPDVVAEPGDLGEHLVVEDEVVGVLFLGEIFQYFAGKGPVAGLVLREFLAQEDILDLGEEPVGDKLVERHAAFQGAGAEDAGGEDRIELTKGDH